MEKKLRKETKEDSSPDKAKKSRERKWSVFPSSLGHVQEIQDHDLLDKEAAYEDISINLHDKDEDCAYPVDAVHEDREHIVYQHCLHPMGPLCRNFINPSERQAEENPMENYLGKKLNVSKRKFSLRVIMGKLSIEQMPVKEKKTSLQEILVKNWSFKIYNTASFCKTIFCLQLPS
jgi:hypothetical protein